MDPRELKEIMSQGAIRPETPRDRREREVLEADLDGSPVVGKPLRRRYRNFRPDADASIRALSGPPVWMRRLRAIEDELVRNELLLGEAWRELAAETHDPGEFARRWEQTAQTWSFGRINDLVERHNRNFPIEAKLAMDPRTRDYVKVNGRPYTRDPLDAGWILERFPADVAAARNAA